MLRDLLACFTTSHFTGLSLAHSPEGLVTRSTTTHMPVCTLRFLPLAAYVHCRKSRDQQSNTCLVTCKLFPPPHTHPCTPPVFPKLFSETKFHFLRGARKEVTCLLGLLQKAADTITGSLVGPLASELSTRATKIQGQCSRSGLRAFLVQRRAAALGRAGQSPIEGCRYGP